MKRSVLIDAAVCSNTGKVRKNNEDNFCFNGLYMDESQRNGGGLFNLSVDDSVQVYAVCDGMGGEEGGEDASLSAVCALTQYFGTCHREVGTDRMKELLQRIRIRVRKMPKQKGTVQDPRSRW